MTRWWRLWAVFLGAPAMAAAQTPLIEPSVALSCLTPAKEQRGTPEYPFDAWKLGRPGRVQVELEFGGPDRKPQTTVLLHEGDDAFIDAVKAHVRQFRVPCVESGTSKARVVFDFVFRPDDRKVVAAQPVDPDHEARMKQLACIRHVSGKGAPAYPPAALRRNLQGRVYLTMEFDAADQPPKATALSGDDGGPLRDAIQAWAAGYRMPCFQAPGPISTSVIYVYLIDGGGSYGFKPLAFTQFLGAVKDLQQQQLDFDFNKMGCPFDVRLTYLQPRLPNHVGQLGDYNPERLPFVDWLKGVQLNLPTALQAAVFADSLMLTIPCTRLTLNP